MDEGNGTSDKGTSRVDPAHWPRTLAPHLSPISAPKLPSWSIQSKAKLTLSAYLVLPMRK